MSTLRTAAQQALEFIRWCQFVPCQSETFPEPPSTAPQVEEALRAALAEPQQKPVAWMVYTLDGKSVCVTDNPNDFTEQHKTLPLYTAPVQRKPLTEEEIENAYREIWRDLPSDFDHTSSGWIEQGIKYAERAHGIKDA